MKAGVFSGRRNRPTRERVRHVAKFDTLAEAYRMAKQNDGAPGVDGVTFDEIEAVGVSVFLTDIREQLLSGDTDRHEHGR
jgi:hypothetical protein